MSGKKAVPTTNKDGLNLFFGNSTEIKPVVKTTIEKKEVVKEVIKPKVVAIESDDCMPLYTALEIGDDLNLMWPVIRDMGEKEFESYAERLRVFFLDQYEKNHYPVGGGDVTLENIIDRLQKFDNLDVNSDMIYFEENGNKILKGYNTWASVVDHWFPEMMDVEISDGTTSVKPSIIGVFRNKKLYMEKIKRTLWKDKLNGWKKEPDKTMWPTLKQSLRLGAGTQPVTNIRGPVAKWIWQTQMLENKHLDEIVVYDPSMGWAGRLVAFLAATNHPDLQNKKCIYIGTDPNSAINPRYKMIEKFWKKYVNTDCKAEVIPLCLPAEDICKTEVFEKYKGKVCVCYTSCPYFNRERYSDDPEQSYIRYKQYSSWRDGFLGPTIKNCYDLLLPQGRLFWNIGNLKIGKDKFLPLESDSIKKAISNNFTHEETLKQLMRFVIGRDNNLDQMNKNKSMNIIDVQGKLTKYEPVFVFKK